MYRQARHVIAGTLVFTATSASLASPMRAQGGGRMDRDTGDAVAPANTPNVHLLSHIPLGRSETISGIAMDQDPNRPYVYVSRMQDPGNPAGFNLISVKDPAHARVIYTYRISDPDLHKGFGGMEGEDVSLCRPLLLRPRLSIQSGVTGRGPGRHRVRCDRVA
jgi:hypothetical protein